MLNYLVQLLVTYNGFTKTMEHVVAAEDVIAARRVALLKEVDVLDPAELDAACADNNYISMELGVLAYEIKDVIELQVVDTVVNGSPMQIQVPIDLSLVPTVAQMPKVADDKKLYLTNTQWYTSQFDKIVEKLFWCYDGFNVEFETLIDACEETDSGEAYNDVEEYGSWDAEDQSGSYSVEWFLELTQYTVVIDNAEYVIFLPDYSLANKDVVNAYWLPVNQFVTR